MKLYHCSYRGNLFILEPHKPRFSPFYGLFLAPLDFIPEWQERLLEDNGNIPQYIYEVIVPDNVIIYIDEPNIRPYEWPLAEYKWDRISGPHKQMWVKTPLEATLL